jgi:hypothetical protein
MGARINEGKRAVGTKAIRVAQLRSDRRDPIKSQGAKQSTQTGLGRRPGCLA